MHVRRLLFLSSVLGGQRASHKRPARGRSMSGSAALAAWSRRSVWPAAGVLLALGLLAACDSTPPACNPALDANACVAAPQCSGSLRDCKNGGLDGCETDVSADINNCGGCGNKCPTPSSGQAVCEDGVCGAATCGTRYKDCNGDPRDGCETDTYRNTDNCGTCGNKCPSGTHAAAACGLGQCKLACQAGYLNCDGQTDNGCEVNGSADINNCGTCGNKCLPSGAANATCAAGSCTVSSCAAPYLTCGAGPTTSCETNISNDANNCGACAKVCDPVDNGTRACQSNNCAIGSCDTGYADCDGQLSNGCEAGTTSNPAHCGSCTPCPGYGLVSTNVGCNINSCSFSCRGDNYDVNGALSDGCEVADNSALHIPGSAAGDRGSKSCVDADSMDTFSGIVASDLRTHENPVIPGFVAATGTAPDYWEVTGTGGAFCINDFTFIFTTSGGGTTPCYLFTVESDRYSDFVFLSGSQTGSISAGIGAYGSDTSIQITVQKTCSVMMSEAVSYTVLYHL